jgi:transcriptional regulator with XRE-family HTH domain
MGKYASLLTNIVGSVEYWTQAAMRRFVLDVDNMMTAQNVSRAQLAEKLGTSPAYVTKIMRGDVNFTLETMTKLALAVGGKLRIEVVGPDALPPKVGLHWHLERHGAVTVPLPACSRVLTLDPNDLPANEAQCELERAA